MISAPPKKGRGRPKKIGPVHTSDASLDRLHRHIPLIVKAMRPPSPFAEYFSQVPAEDFDLMAYHLAQEFAFFSALLSLAASTPKVSRGPRPKTAQALLIAQVAQVLQQRGVVIPQWRNSRSSSSQLVLFCCYLARLTETPGILISWRTVSQAPCAGWSVLLKAEDSPLIEP
jgi:hypothetical protein